MCESPWDGGGELDPDAEVLVWLDVDADDWEEWTAAQSAPVNYEALAPDSVDPRADAAWEPGLGIHTIAVELRLPD